MYDMANSVAANRGTHNGNRKNQKILQPVQAIHFQYERPWHEWCYVSRHDSNLQFCRRSHAHV
jgi:hypothetical protein